MANTIDLAICPQNHRCPLLRECPEGAITQDSYDGLPIIDENKCTECGICDRYCAMGAVHRV